MRAWLICFIGLLTLAYAQEDTSTFKMQRIIPQECKNVRIATEDIYSGNYAGKSVPEACQKSIVTVVGRPQPISLDPKIMTLGEVEVVDFIEHKLAKDPAHYVLVDARKRDWFEQMTIPHSVNIPYDEIAFDPAIPEDFERIQNLLGFSGKEGKFDFSHAKTALLFCNGPWCAQSHLAMQELIKLGYPKEKLLWYRGGLQDWVLFGYPTVQPKK